MQFSELNEHWKHSFYASAMNNLRYLMAKRDIPFNLYEHTVPSWGKNEKGGDKFTVFLINISLRNRRNLVYADAAACLTASPWRSSHPDDCPTVSSPWARQSLFIPLLYWRWDLGANIGRKYVTPMGIIYTHMNAFPSTCLWDQLTF